jgi:hypothetical protein
MTNSVDRYFEIHDACVRSGGVLSEFAAAMIDTIVTGGPLQTNGAAVSPTTRLSPNLAAAASIALQSPRFQEARWPSHPMRR